MSLSSPASWAAEMNLQSRYPRGIVVTMICLASLLSVCVLVSAKRADVAPANPAVIRVASTRWTGSLLMVHLLHGELPYSFISPCDSWVIHQFRLRFRAQLIFCLCAPRGTVAFKVTCLTTNCA